MTAAAALAVILWIIAPIGTGILLGTFLAFMAEPFFHRMHKKFGARWASVITIVSACAALAAVIGGLGVLFVTRGTVLVTALVNSFKPGGSGDRALSALAHVTDRMGISRDDLTERAHQLATHLAEKTAEIAAALVSATGSALLGLLFAMMAMYYVLRNWPAMLRYAQGTLPLKPEYTLALFDSFRVAGRTTLVGAIGTALAQGAFAAIGFALVGAPEPLVLGAATAVASFVPVVGVLIVIVPVGIVLFASGHPIAAAVELVWSLVFVVGVCDYAIRPRLVRGETKLPALVTFAALFGGIETFGLKGLILGPVLMSVTLAVLRIYSDEVRASR